MEIKKKHSDESVQSFKNWWLKRKTTMESLPNFFDVWDARQEEIEKLKSENEELKKKLGISQ